MATAQQKLRLDAYIAWENAQPERHAFHRGEVFSMDRRIAELRESVLIDPDSHSAEVFRRNAACSNCTISPARPRWNSPARNCAALWRTCSAG